MTPSESPRQMFQMLGLSRSQLDSFTDDADTLPNDEEALIRILHRMPQVSLADIHRWQQSTVPWTALRARPGDYRIQFFEIPGRVRAVARETLGPRLAELFDFETFYRVRVSVPASQEAVEVYTRSVPRNWQDGMRGDERARVSGLFLKRGVGGRLVFAAPRVAWLPDRVDPAAGISRSHVLLGDLGMDVGLLDLARARNRMRMGVAERECFYQLLAAASRAQPEQLERHAEALDLAQLLQQPEAVQGRVVHVRGTVCRITRILIQDPDIRARFELGHYYQLDVLVPLGNQIIRMKDGKSGRDGPVYSNHFPFTFCTVRLPADWSDAVDRDQVSMPASLNAFFYKLWVYPNPLVGQYDKRQRQISPMFVALEPQPVATTAVSDRPAGPLFGIAFVAILAVIWLFVWRAHRSDRPSRALRRQRP